MTTATLTLGGRKFVVIPEGEYRKLKARATKTTPANGGAPRRRRRGERAPTKQELGDIAESKRRLEEPGRVLHQDLKRELGL